MRTLPTLTRAVAVVALGGALVACGDDGDTVTEGATQQTDASGSVVVTTNILGDVVENLVGDAVDLEVIMPAGADPHDFAPSAQQAATMRSADLLIVNGLGFEEGLLSAIEGAEEDGVVVYEATSAITTIDFGEGGHGHGDDGHGHDDDDHGHDDDDHGHTHDDDDHGHDDDDHDHGHDDDDHGHDDGHGHDHDDEGALGISGIRSAPASDDDHDDDDHGHGDDDHGHSHDGDDPHFFTDPARMAVAVEGIADALAENVDGLEGDEFRARVDGYVDELLALDAEIEALVEALPEDQRVLITNHEVFGYFADRYGFEVLGSVIPGGSTLAEPSASDLAALAQAMEDEGVRAVFAETSAPARLADALAAEVGGEVEVVELFSESLGEPGSGGETYLDMVRTNAERIVEALS